MRRYIIGIIGLMMSLALSAQVTYTRADSLTICKLLKQAPQALVRPSVSWYSLCGPHLGGEQSGTIGGKHS